MPLVRLLQLAFARQHVPPLANSASVQESVAQYVVFAAATVVALGHVFEDALQSCLVAQHALVLSAPKSAAAQAAPAHRLVPLM